MAALDQESLQSGLKKRKICRFCLSQDLNKLTNIFMRDTRIKSSAMLPIQIMAIASIEVFSNDDMPPYVCSDCTNMFEYSYQFSQMCKKADNLLRQFPLTGKWPNCLDKPVLAQSEVVTPGGVTKTTHDIYEIRQASTFEESFILPKEILSSSINCNTKTASTTSTVLTLNIQQKSKRDINVIDNTESECAITSLDKSVEDVQRLVAAEDKSETELESMENLPLIVVKSANKTNIPKLLNKSSIRFLSKNPEKGKESCPNLPKVNKDANGKTEIFAEINFNDIKVEESDSKNAVPVEKNYFPCSLCERSFPLLQLRDIHMKNHSRDRKFQCEICAKLFISKSDMNRHLFTHNGERPYKCIVCDKGFIKSAQLIAHEKTHIDATKLRCDYCDQTSLSKTAIEIHAKKHKIPPPYLCNICNKGFAFKQGLERHEVLHCRQQPFSCHYCEESFSNQTKLARHLTAHAGERPYPCKYCKKSFLKSHHLGRHLRSHNNIDDMIAFSFMCAQCNTRLASREELISHTSTHANELNLTCSLCKDVFSTIIELNTHIQQHSNADTFACEFCDLIFVCAAKLQSHTDLDHSHEMEAYYADDRAKALKQLEDLKNLKTDISGDQSDSKYAAPIKRNVFKCSFCRRKFPLLQQRDIHMKNHLRDRKFQCEICEKSFLSKSILNNHLFIHNGERPYKCAVCEKGFLKLDVLRTHEKTHIDAPKFTCDYCDWTSLSKTDFEKHAKRHKIPRPFLCKICNKGFAFRQSLARHKVKHCRQQPFSCHYCEEDFSTKTQLARHLDTHTERYLRPDKNVKKEITSISTRCNIGLASREQLTCFLCKTVFDTMSALNCHLQEHSKGDNFVCEICDLIFITEDKLKSHRDVDHAPEMDPCYADDCDKVDKQLEI